jgi:F-type H+-transporting ATPase subunit b
MSSSINIYPFSDTEGLIRFGAQIAIFLIGLYAAHKFIIKPSLRLHEERKKRTVGSSEAAKKDLERAIALEHEYFTRLKEGADHARNLRQLEISEAQKLALTYVNETQHKSNEYVKRIREQLEKETLEAKTQLIPHVEDIVSTVYKKLGLTTVLVFVFASSLVYHSNVLASENSVLIPSFWYSIFWPYFQFLVFAIAIVYFAKKPIQDLLEQKRDDFRTKLSEAHEAVYLANKKVKEYEAKVASLESEINALHERNKEEAKLERERIIEDANKACTIILKDAERSAIELIHSSKEEIKKELFSMAMLEVEKRLTDENMLHLDKNLKQEALDNIKNFH